jgi:ATP-dependent DNA ligase
MATPNGAPTSAGDRRHWRPQEARPARRPAEIADPILEPRWRGRRVIAHFRVQTTADGTDTGIVELLDARGQDITGEAPRVAETLRAAIMALEAVIDGVLTGQIADGGVGTALTALAPPNLPSLLAPRTLIGGERARPPAGPGETAFVALDLLSIDGQSLLDVPLLERRRQLETLFLESELLRVTPYARPPIRPWFNTWKSAGFDGLVMKAANSRYRPGELTSDWTIIKRL